MTDRLLELLDRPVEQAAAGLLGWRLRTELADGPTEVELCEIEAYGGADDPASHAFRGRTRRNSSMFAGAGTLYVYRSYGVHWCANVVTGEPGEAGALLLRGGVPSVGRNIMEGRRGRQDHLTDGPGRLCQALGIDGSHDGTSLLGGSIRLLPPAGRPGGEIVATPRIGISRATDRLWRFRFQVPGSRF
ncbi:MAG TPA: DNA-3-methyladenine glycosylase [Acidimicrobiia bacterium]|nr:DNA-3-methyladenine glycosylase [Acidimicrobiia bacterium]